MDFPQGRQVVGPFCHSFQGVRVQRCSFDIPARNFHLRYKTYIGHYFRDKEALIRSWAGVLFDAPNTRARRVICE